MTYTKLEYQRRENRAEGILEVIMAKNFSKLMTPNHRSRVRSSENIKQDKCQKYIQMSFSSCRISKTISWKKLGAGERRRKRRRGVWRWRQANTIYLQKIFESEFRLIVNLYGNSREILEKFFKRSIIDIFKREEKINMKILK